MREVKTTVHLTQNNIQRLVERLHTKIRKEFAHVGEIKIYGVPRGGVYIAYLLQAFGKYRVLDDAADADIIVDDIIDSGKTKKSFSTLGRKFFAAVPEHEKRGNDTAHKWVIFPWETFSDDKEDTVIRQLQQIGEKLKRPGLIDTPSRVVRSWKEIYAGYEMSPAVILSKRFPNTEKYNEMVMLNNIKFYSMCEHHMLPFYGVIHIAYIPDKEIVGISKLVRLVHCFSKRLQIQEAMTQQIADAIQENLKPLGIGVICQAEHLCMKMRGVQNFSSSMLTSALKGVFLENANFSRNEFLSLIKC